jgi:tRNA modification GTPase
LSDFTTIFAPASAPGRAALAVVRVSGPAAGAALEALGASPPPTARYARLCHLRDPVSGAPLDRALVLWFPAPASYTGEDMAEFHVHGGPAVLDGLLGALGALEGVGPAQPGEFTERAFRNDKLDLTAAEAIADLIAAQTAAQRQQALAQLDGGLARTVEAWRSGLIEAMAWLEAGIDFSDQPVPDDMSAEVSHKISEIENEITQYLDDSHRGERLREGLAIAILGAPNVGKSSLLNRLAKRDAAIVSEQAGTTRDVIEVMLDLGGFPVILADTAGLRETGNAGGDLIEREGVRRARARAASADLRIVMLDASDPSATLDDTLYIVEDEDRPTETVVVLNKADLLDEPTNAPAVPHDALSISCHTGAGLDQLLERLEASCAAMLCNREAPALTRQRHRQALEDCAGAVARARPPLAGPGSAADLATAPELAAEDLRLAARALGRITGRVDVEDILDVVFREFCIGK